MRLLKDDFHVIKRNGLNSALNCYEAKPEESVCVSTDNFAIGEREAAGRI